MFLIYGDKGLHGHDLFREILQSLKYTFLVIALPYAAVLYYLHSSKQKQKYFQVDKSEKNIIKILDENQNVRIAIEPDKLLFIKNADNYVEIFYANNEGISKELVRTSLKRLESELRDFKVMRCHRSYMVNIKNVSLSKKTRKGLNLELRIENAPLIPVSKNYTSDILNEL
jgi:DNA-binding LytR/AlgR family response regulator